MLKACNYLFSHRISMFVSTRYVYRYKQYQFSTSSQNSSNSSSAKSQNINPSVNQQQFERQHRLKLRKQRQKQEIQNMNKAFNRTSDQFNSLIEYLRLFKYQLIIGTFCVLFGMVGIGTYLTIGIDEIQSISESGSIVTIKKFAIISSQYEQNLKNILLKIFTSYTSSLQRYSKDNQQDVPEKIKSILYDHRIQIEQIYIMEWKQPIILVLPGKTAVVSSSLYRKAKQSQLKALLMLFDCLFRLRFHIRDLPLSQIVSFWFPYFISEEMVMRQIYTRVYDSQELSDTMQLLEKKFGKETVQQIIESLKQIRQQFYGNKKAEIMNSLNIFTRLAIIS